MFFNLRLSIIKMFGYKYLVNMNPKSKEIHDLTNTKYQCFIPKIKNKKYIRYSDLPKYFKMGYDGCRWCNNEMDFKG
jgi:hypothetical protein